MNGRLTRHNENQARCRRFSLPLPVQADEQMKKRSSVYDERGFSRAL
jgi:hypothetical protein